MMVTSNVLLTHTLSLTEEDRIWLLGFVQNSPLCDDEPSDDASRREKLFNALKKPKVNHITQPVLT